MNFSGEESCRVLSNSVISVKTLHFVFLSLKSRVLSWAHVEEPEKSCCVHKAVIPLMNPAWACNPSFSPGKWGSVTCRVIFPSFGVTFKLVRLSWCSWWWRSGARPHTGASAAQLDLENSSVINVCGRALFL